MRAVPATKTKPKPRKAAAKATPKPEPFTIELDGTQAQRLFSAVRIIATFASRDDARPALCAVRFRSDGTKVVVEATDSYRLARISLVGFDGLAQFDFIVDGLWLTANLRKGRIVPVETFRFNVSESRFEVVDDHASTTASIGLSGADYPNTDDLWDAEDVVTPNPDDKPVGFNPKFLGAIFKAAHAFGDYDALRVRHLDPMKPNRFEVVTGDGTLQMLLMPVRIP